MNEERYDRQRRIEGWDQDSLRNASVCFIGDNKIIESLVLSSAGLGIGAIRAIKPKTKSKDFGFLKIAKAISPSMNYFSLDSFFVNRNQIDYLGKSDAIVDINGFNVGKKLSIEWLFQNNDKKGILVNPHQDNVEMYTYYKENESENLKMALPSKSLPYEYNVDPILAIVSSGLILEELKNILMKRKTSDEVIKYSVERIVSKEEDYSKKKVAIMGAGALGNFVGLCLKLIGVGNIDITDSDVIEETNLNRQVLYYDLVGEKKALALSKRLSSKDIHCRGFAQNFDENTDIKGYDAIFDCFDSFKPRMLLSERCVNERVPLISGGTNYHSGQVVMYIPGITSSPKEILGLEDLVKKQAEERERRGCIYQPNPSVIMSNQIIGGVMVNEFRKLCFPENYKPVANRIIKYDAEDEKRIRIMEVAKNE